MPSDEAPNIGCVQPGHVDDAAGKLLLQQQTNDAAMVAACACRKATDVMQVVVVPPQFVGDGIGEGCAWARRLRAPGLGGWGHERLLE